MVGADLGNDRKYIHLRRGNSDGAENGSYAIRNVVFKSKFMSDRGAKVDLRTKLRVKDRMSRPGLVHVKMCAVDVFEGACLRAEVCDLCPEILCLKKAGLEVGSFKAEPALHHDIEVGATSVWTFWYVKDHRANVEFDDMIRCCLVDLEYFVGRRGFSPSI